MILVRSPGSRDIPFSGINAATAPFGSGKDTDTQKVPLSRLTHETLVFIIFMAPLLDLGTDQSQDSDWPVGPDLRPVLFDTPLRAAQKPKTADGCTQEAAIDSHRVWRSCIIPDIQKRERRAQLIWVLYDFPPGHYQK